MRLLPLILLSLSSSMVGAQSVPAGLFGRWAGVTLEQGTPRLFELTFSRAADGGLATELTLPYNGYDSFPFAFAYDTIGNADGQLTAALFGDQMQLSVDLAEGHLRGVVIRADTVAARVHLQKVPAYPLPPITTAEVRFPAGPDTLAATLLRPAGRVRPPVALLVPGRGQTSRAEGLGWARLLARNGIAAVAWDGRGTGRSTGDTATVTSDVLIADVRAALEWALAQADLGPVGMLSYSAGAWVAPIVAADRDDVAFVVSLVGPVGSLAEQQGQATVAFMRAAGTDFSGAEYAAAFAYQQETVRLAQAGAPWSAFEAINRAAQASRWREHALIPTSLDDADLAYFARHRFEAPPWGRLRAPVLAVFGEIDLLVPPADNVERLRAALVANRDVTIVVAPGTDHTLARPPGYVGEGDERYYRPWTRSAVVFDTLISWFAARFP